MPERCLQLIFGLLLLVSANSFAQDNDNWVFRSRYSGKYYGSPYDIRWGYFENKETGRFNIKSLAEAQLVIQKNLANKVIAVELENIPTQDLSNIYLTLAKYPKLTYIRLHGNDINTVDQLADNINRLKYVKGVEFAYADDIDMDHALKKLSSISQLQILSFTQYKSKLPPSISLFKQLDSVKLSTLNIGNNDLRNVSWKKVSVTGDPKSWQDSTGARARDEAKSLLKIAQIKLLRHLGLEVDIRYPGFISQFKQIDELQVGGAIDNRPSTPFMQAVGALTHLQNLWIELAGDKLTADISPLKNLTQLRSFYLKLNNQGSSALETLSNFKNLEFLTVVQTKIGAMPDIFQDMQHLKTIILSNTGITKVPASLFNLPALENLDLMQNSITSLPPLVSFGCIKLKHVNLMMNRLNSLPPAFGSLPELETINCSHNKIETIPEGWAYLKNLKEVNFAINHLTQFPEGLQNNHSVERITLFFNDIEAFPDVEGDDYKLRYLGITGNRNMFELPEHIGSYSQLDTLAAEYLRLNSLPESLGDCKKLKMLLLNRSIAKKTSLPAGLKDAKNLEILQLNDNPLLDKQGVPEAIQSRKHHN